MDIKEIQNLVKDHINIKDDEIYQIPKEISYGNFLLLGGQLHSKRYQITDNVNNDGYRSDEFKGDNGFLFLGCSFTFGFGLEEYESWPWIVGKHFNVKVWNASVFREGDDVCFINAIKWIPKLKPKVVCMMIPPPGRHKFFDYDKKIDKEFYGWTLPKEPKFPWLFNSKHLYLSTLKNIMGIKLICDEFDIPFIVKSCDTHSFQGTLKGYWENFKRRIYLSDDDKARDGSHPGSKWHQKMADDYIKEIEKCI